MDITSKILVRLGVSRALAAKYAEQLDRQLEIHGINTHLRCAHFLAQVLHESSRLSRIRENLNYSKTGLRKTFPRYFSEPEAADYARQPERIANRVYANRLGNGNEASGDGWRYRGRGLIQLTGKDNYQSFSDWVGDDVVTDPDKVATTYAVACAVFFWERNGLNALADADDVNAVTKRINGGYNGLQDRVELTELAKAVLPEHEPAVTAGVEAPSVASSLGVLLSEQPQLRTYQDLINFFYKTSDRTFPGATRLAERFGLDIAVLVKSRSAPVERLLVDTDAPAVSLEDVNSRDSQADTDTRNAKVRSISVLVNLALGEIGTREVGGNNMGEEVVEYQRATWLNPAPWPWCAAFTCWLLREWWEDPETRALIGIGSEFEAEKIRCRDASAFGWEKWAIKRGYQVLPESTLAKAGDFVVFDFSHIGLVIADQGSPDDEILTVEGNTNGRGERDSETGDGVWKKKRKSGLTKSYIRLLP